MYGQRIGSGRTAEIFEYGDGRVLKLYHAGMPEDQVEAEYQIGRFVCQSGVSSPIPFERVRYDDRHGIVYERVDGVTMLASLTQQPGGPAAEAERMAKLHSRIHGLSIPGLPSQKAHLGERIRHAPLLSGEEKEQIALYLRDLPDGDRLCHGDYHPDNIMLGEKEWIIDWMTGMSGHPAGDVARTALLLQFGSVPDEAPGEVVEWLAAMRMQLLEAYLQAYTSYAGMTWHDIRRWMLPVAAARLCEWIPDAEKEALAAFIREHIPDGGGIHE